MHVSTRVSVTSYTCHRVNCYTRYTHLRAQMSTPHKTSTTHLAPTQKYPPPYNHKSRYVNASFVMQRNKEQRLQLPNVASYEHRPLHARQDIRPGRPHNPTQGEGRMRDTSSPRPATEREKNGTNTYNMPTPCM